MKLLGENETAKINRKLLKPQVERRRRERMNRCFESLRMLLLQGPEHQALSQRRVEKAEILEHTVLFLHNSSAQTKRTTDERRERHPFLDGFSTCMQEAARYLQEEKGLDDALTTSLRQRMAFVYSPPTTPVPAHVQPALSMPRTESQDCQQQVSDCRKHTHASSSLSSSSLGLRKVVHPYRAPLKHANPNALCHHSNTQSSGRRPHSTHQSVWRPWP
ncbi:hairy and enhancer of split related-7 [Chanos chanos]|uniref:Hairy and enhancer of split related-7 n=1 Tax=Chanos chanos TaxID=29144 RepID=A0A6J2WWV0_CHACN|nr:transcription factor HES-7.1-like [Chanos chanos]